MLVPRGQNVAVLTLTSQTGFNPYPQARDLMRRMLGLKPIAAAKKKAAVPPPLGVPVEAARFVRALERRDAATLLVLRGLLGGLERVQHLLLHVGGASESGCTVLPQYGLMRLAR